VSNSFLKSSFSRENGLIFVFWNLVKNRTTPPSSWVIFIFALTHQNRAPRETFPETGQKQKYELRFFKKEKRKIRRFSMKMDCIFSCCVFLQGLFVPITPRKILGWLSTLQILLVSVCLGCSGKINMFLENKNWFFSLFDRLWCSSAVFNHFYCAHMVKLTLFLWIESFFKSPFQNLFRISEI